MIIQRTGSGPSSNDNAQTPSGTSHHTSGFILHLAAVEHTKLDIGSRSPGYFRLPPSKYEGGISGILPCEMAMSRASTQGEGSSVMSGFPFGYESIHSVSLTELELIEW